MIFSLICHTNSKMPAPSPVPLIVGETTRWVGQAGDAIKIALKMSKIP